MILSMLCTLALSSSILTYILLRIFSEKNILTDLPNKRSLHTVSLVRGGGLSIVVCFLLGITWLYFIEIIDRNSHTLLLIPGLCVSLLGFIDDLKSLSPKTRLGVQAGIAFFIFMISHDFSLFSKLGHLEQFNALGCLLSLFYILWLVNLFNFMDGINGIVSIEVLSPSLSISLILYLVSPGHPLMYLLLSISACTIGFLPWNFPSARIFLGDCGSYFLGLMMAILSFQNVEEIPNIFYVWLIMLGVFVIDTTFTLTKRILAKEKIFESHRSHAYQISALKFKSHKLITNSVLMII